MRHLLQQHLLFWDLRTPTSNELLEHLAPAEDGVHEVRVALVLVLDDVIEDVQEEVDVPAACIL